MAGLDGAQGSFPSPHIRSLQSALGGPGSASQTLLPDAEEARSPKEAAEMGRRGPKAFSGSEPKDTVTSAPGGLCAAAPTPTSRRAGRWRRRGRRFKKQENSEVAGATPRSSFCFCFLF